MSVDESHPIYGVYPIYRKSKNVSKEVNAMKTFQFKLYRADKNSKFHNQINCAGLTYNHCIALHKRYYKLFGKYLKKGKLQKHLTKLKKVAKFSYLKQSGWKLDEDNHILQINGQNFKYFQSRKISGK